MNRIVELYVPGINWTTGGWDGEAQHWGNLNPLTPAVTTVDDMVVVDRADYQCGPITRAWHQQDRIDRFNSILKDYVLRGFDIRITGHSNGTDIILRGMAQMKWPAVTAMHLVSGACQADFNRNGLNRALNTNRIGKLFVYVAGRDMALRLASLGISRLLGYGTLGLHGAINVDPAIPKRKLDVTIEPDYGHSDWWLRANWLKTMARIRRTE